MHALASQQTAMPLSVVEKASKRYRESFEKGIEPPPPRTAANAALLEEVRAEVEQGKAVVGVNVRKGVKRVQEAAAKGQAQLEEKSAVCQRLLEEKAACLVASFAAGSSGGGSCSGGDASEAAAAEEPSEAPAEKPELAPTGSQTNAQKRKAEEAERQRLASLAREAEARQEKKRRRALDDQARRELNPRASKCQKCEDADFVLGGLCAEHQEELRIIAARLSEESVVPLSGSAAESCDSE